MSTSAAPKQQGKVKQESLDRVPVDIQEALIWEDLLFVLMVCSLISLECRAHVGFKGIEGTYVTFHPDYLPEDDDPLQGIRFVVSPSLGSGFSGAFFSMVSNSPGRLVIE